MEAVQKDHWYLLVLLIFFPLLKVAVQQRESVATVSLEEGMVLECLCPWEGNLSMVSWTKVPEKDPVAVFHPDYGVAFSHLYQGRVTFIRGTHLDGSIAISNISQQDLGLYRCFVQTFPQGSWTRDIMVELHDSEEPELLTTAVTPEVIQVDTELVAERSDNLTISCKHKHNGTVYEVTVEKLGLNQWGGGTGIMAVCRVVDGGLVGEEFLSRGRVYCTDSLDVSLQLTELVEEDGGFYRCRFSTDAGVQTTTVLLTVPGPGESSLSEYMIYIYVGSGAAVVLLLAVTLLLFALHRKKKRREEYRVRLHPAHRQHPNTYENIDLHDKMEEGKTAKKPRESPVYANVQTLRQENKRKR
ncbi:CD226 antigen isoform X1 [Hypomesus transpacificus]|uniref:CD226 antigen isoform X1 n=1 Tax=Hypomesus transpacificus TaxID=137520 RepID=UPI001F076707|nr:CD226 antigen isoform X1 [Hypomesus transpacificus]